MGVFMVDVRVTKPGRRPRWKTFRRVLETSSIVMANGQYLPRNVGTALIDCGQLKTVDEVVSAQAGDLSPLGARTPEGFNAARAPRRSSS